MAASGSASARVPAMPRQHCTTTAMSARVSASQRRVSAGTSDKARKLSCAAALDADATTALHSAARRIVAGGTADKRVGWIAAFSRSRRGVCFRHHVAMAIVCSQ